MLSIPDSESVYIRAFDTSRSQVLQADVKRQSQCLQLKMLKSTKTFLQSFLLRQKPDNHCDKAKDETKTQLTN